MKGTIAPSEAGSNPSGESELRRSKLLRLATEDAQRNIGKILTILRRTGLEHELSETDIRQIEQGITGQISENPSYENHRNEALSLINTIGIRRRAIATLGGLQ